MAYVAIVKSSNNKVEKYMEFDSKSDADAHVKTHGGFVADAVGGDTEFWVVDESAKTVTFDTSAANTTQAKAETLAKIYSLETEITQRRQREAGSDDAGGSQSGRDWMKAQEAKIATERGKL